MAAHLDREREAQEEMARTELGAPTAALVVALFLAILPLLALVERFAPRPKTSAEREVSMQWPTVGALARARVEHGWLGLNDELRRGIDSVDGWFERGSELGQWIRPPVQRLMLERLGYGNGLVRSGRDGWLFWEKEISAVTAPPYLDPKTLARERLRGPETDPATAIVEFGAQLRRRGIELVVVPIPGKVEIEAAHLAGQAVAGSTPIRNASDPELARRLQEAGIELFDPAPLLAERARTLGPQYQRTDSHWLPEAMAAVAHDLAARLRQRHGLTPILEARLADSPQTRNGGHDLVGLLGFPKRGEGPMYDRVVLRQVVVPDEAQLARDAPDGGILLLGDSYAKIYSTNFESYGAGAGFADLLTLELGRPVARLLVDAGGDFDSREALVGQLADRPYFLDPIRIVVYEFAARELSIGRWRKAELPEPASSSGAAAAAPRTPAPYTEAMPETEKTPSAPAKKKHRPKRHSDAR